MSTETLKFENVAIYRVGMFGINRTDCKTLTIMTGQKYAQYNDAVRYQLLEKGKRKPAAYVMAENEPWFRVVELFNAPTPSDGLDKQPDGSSRSRYTSYDMRYVTDFEDKLTASGARILWEVGKGHRGLCGCGLCRNRLKECATPIDLGTVSAGEDAFTEDVEDDPFIAGLPL